jgi:hypothetical protein
LRYKYEINCDGEDSNTSVRTQQTGERLLGLKTTSGIHGSGGGHEKGGPIEAIFLDVNLESVITYISQIT